MKPSLTFFVVGIPKGQPRVRAFVRGKHAGVYDPGTADDWKAAIRQELLRQWDQQPFTGPIRAHFDCYLPRPKKHINARGQTKDDAPKHHTGRPDVDNIAKAILDVLQACGVFRDDSQVSCLLVTKQYTSLSSGASIVLEEAVE